MLKILPPANLGNQAKAKCGEIFCHSSTDFTIYCTFCDMKAFSFEDFLLHVQNVHFENNLLKTETLNNDCNDYLDVKVKNEVTSNVPDQLHEDEFVWSNLEQTYDDDLDDIGADDDDDYDNESYEEEIVSVLKKPKKKVRVKREKKPKQKIENESEDEDNDHSSDEDFKPMVGSKIFFVFSKTTSCSGS